MDEIKESSFPTSTPTACTASITVSLAVKTSSMRCYALSTSPHSFRVITPHIGYEAIFVKLPTELNGVLEPDMVLLMSRTLPRLSFSTTSVHFPINQPLFLVPIFNFRGSCPQINVWDPEETPD